MKNNAVDREIAELNKTMQGLQQKSNEILFNLGKQYYGKHGNDPEPEFAQNVNEEKTVLEQMKKVDTRIKFLHGIVVCTNCGTDNNVQSSFCQNCGTRLPHTYAQHQDGTKRCEKCGSVLNPGQRFCGACGTPVAEEAPAEKTVQQAEGMPEGNDALTAASPAAEEVLTAEAAATAEETTVAKKFCANCGAEIVEADALFCAECGTRI